MLTAKFRDLLVAAAALRYIDPEGAASFAMAYAALGSYVAALVIGMWNESDWS